jgi:hypothetical protein
LTRGRQRSCAISLGSAIASLVAMVARRHLSRSGISGDVISFENSIFP